MAIASVNEIAGSSGGQNENSELTAVRKYRVVTTSRYTGALLVLDAVDPNTGVGIPRKGDIYDKGGDFAIALRAKSATADQDEDNPLVWIVTVNYDRVTAEKDENPLKRPYEISWGFAQFTKVCWQDRDGDAVMNSAMQYFDPPLEIDDSRPVLNITRNEPHYNPQRAIEYKDAVNSDRFFGFPAGQAKVANIQATQADENGIVFWKIAYEFHFRLEGWEPIKVLDQGRYRLVAAAADGTLWHSPIPEYDENGVKIPDSHVTDPVPLDGNGQRLANPNPNNVKYIDVKAYPVKPFRVFGF